MTDRHTADSINGNDLDQLYADRDQARQRAADAYGQRDRLRHRIAALAERWQLPGHISMPDAAAEIADALDREKWAPVPDQLARVRALRDDLRGITGARYIADMLDKILDPPGPAATEATEVCGAEPPRETTGTGGQIWTAGDCWCTLPPDHDGQHHCQPCADRHGAPSWTDTQEQP